jgi:hypothetical protein
MEPANGATRASACEVGAQVPQELGDVAIAPEVLPAPGDRAVVVDPDRARVPRTPPDMPGRVIERTDRLHVFSLAPRARRTIGDDAATGFGLLPSRPAGASNGK